MPSSSAYGKTYSALMIARLHAGNALGRVLDLGVGRGTYAELLRPHTPGAAWTGVEVWAPYAERFRLSEKYDRLLIADIRRVDYPALGRFDLALLGDVIEHMKKDEALAVLDAVMGVADLAIVSLPIVPHRQSAVHGNPFERHVKEDWSHAEVWESFPALAAAFLHDHIGVYVLSRGPAAAARIARLHDQVAPLVRDRFPRDAIDWSGRRRDASA